jgi:hypothetical protein
MAHYPDHKCLRGLDAPHGTFLRMFGFSAEYFNKLAIFGGFLYSFDYVFIIFLNDPTMRRLLVRA